MRASAPFIAGLRAISALTDQRLADFDVSILDAFDRGDLISVKPVADQRVHVPFFDFGHAATREASQITCPS